MKEKLSAIKNALSKKNKSRYGWSLSIVALVEVAMILLVSTYAWVETISSIRISNSDKIGKIDTYTYTDALVGVGSDYNHQIDLSQYFRASGNVHMASASSADGQNFFFPQIAKTGDSSVDSRYRKGGINDKNTNYISFSFKVKSVGKNTDFYFETVPDFKIGDTLLEQNQVRIALTVANEDGTSPVTKIYSKNTVESESVVANTNGSQSQSVNINAFKDYVFKGESETSNQPLFSVETDKTKLVTLTAWLQDPDTTDDYSGKRLTVSNFSIITGATKKTIKFIDKTSAYNSPNATKDTWQWVSNDSNDMWVKTATGSYYKMDPVTNEASTKVTEWEVRISPEDLGDYNNYMYFYRSPNTITGNPDADSKYNNYWQGKLSDASSQGAYTFTAYGNIAEGHSKLGYGTWKDVCLIHLMSENQSVLNTPSTPSSATEVTLKTKNNTSVVPMNYNEGYWKAYIPNDENSKELTFTFSGKSIYAPNRYDDNESKFHITTDKTGFWEPAATVKVNVASGCEGMGTVSVSGGAENATEVRVTAGTEVDLIATPGNDYAFEGWYKNSQCTDPYSRASTEKYTADKKAETVEFFAKFQYNVRVNAKTYDEIDYSTGEIKGDGKVNTLGGKVQINDRTANDKDNLSVLPGGSVTLKAVQTGTQKEDYDFTGWYHKDGSKISNDDRQIQTTLNITDLNEPIDYYAHFNVKTFAVEADVKEGNGNAEFYINSDNKASGVYIKINAKNTETVTYKAVAADSDGYKFVGWYKDEALSTLHTTDKEFTVDKNTSPKKYYAKFELKKYEVNAIAVTDGVQGDTGGTVQITYGDKTTVAGSTAKVENVVHGTSITLKANKKDGYDFEGWYDAATGGNLIDDSKGTSEELTISPVKAIKAYARFKLSKKTTTIYFAPRDGFESYNAYIYNSGAEKKYNGDWPGKAATYDDATGNYKIEFSVPASEANGFCVIISNNGNNQHPGSSQSGRYGEFGKNYWFDSSSDTGNLPEYNPVSVTLGAVLFNSDNVKVSESFTGGSIKVGSNTYTEPKKLTYNKNDKFTATAIANSGYEFKGWYTDAECNNSVGTTLSNVTLDSNKTYYAKFAKQSNVTITFEDNTTDNWASGAGKVYLYDTDTNTVYNSNENGYSNHKATFTVPGSVRNITFYRYEGDYGTSTCWSTISAGNRGSSKTYKITGGFGTISGSWS